MGFIMEIDVDDNPGDAVVYLGALSAIGSDPTSSWFNVVILISPTTGCGYLIPISSMVWIGQAIMPPVLLSQIQTASQAVSVFTVIRFFEDIQKVIIYRKFLAVVSPDEE